jgi:hypothetical protein
MRCCWASLLFELGFAKGFDPNVLTTYAVEIFKYAEHKLKKKRNEWSVQVQHGDAAHVIITTSASNFKKEQAQGKEVTYSSSGGQIWN